jgi:hypothetical protein
MSDNRVICKVLGFNREHYIFFCFFSFVFPSWNRVRLSPFGKSVTNCSIVPAPDDRWVWGNWRNENWWGKPKYSEKTHPNSTLSSINLTWLELGSNLGCRGGKPATNCLSYGTAKEKVLTEEWRKLHQKELYSFCCSKNIIKWVYSYHAGYGGVACNARDTAKTCKPEGTGKGARVPTEPTAVPKPEAVATLCEGVRHTAPTLTHSVLMFICCSRFLSQYTDDTYCPLLLGNERLIWSVPHVNASWNM